MTKHFMSMRFKGLFLENLAHSINIGKTGGIKIGFFKKS